MLVVPGHNGLSPLSRARRMRAAGGQFSRGAQIIHFSSLSGDEWDIVIAARSGHLRPLLCRSNR